MLVLNFPIALTKSSFSFSISSNLSTSFLESSSATKFTGPIRSLCNNNFSKSRFAFSRFGNSSLIFNNLWKSFGSILSLSKIIALSSFCFSAA